MSKDKSKSKQKKQGSFYKGLTLKEFRKIGKIPVRMNDIAWAGRLSYVLPHYWNLLSKSLIVLCMISILMLGVIWIALMTKPSALLIAVYPNSQMVCFPNLLTKDGNPSNIHPSYSEVCNSMAARSGIRWDTQNNKSRVSDIDAIGNLENSKERETIKEILGLENKVESTGENK